MRWTPQRIERLRALLADGLSYSKAGKRMNCTRVAVAGAVRRHIQKIPDPRHTGMPRQDGLWREKDLIEPYAERKKRLAAERAL